MNFKQLLLASVFLAAFSPTRAQEVDSNRRLTIILRDGTVYHGTLAYDDGREMKFNTEELGLLVLKKQDLRRMEDNDEASKTSSDTFVPVTKEGPFTTRYGITTNGFAIKKGENYGLVSLHGPEIHFAVTDRLNIGYMTTWAASPMAVSLKYTFTTDESPVQVSAGSLLMSSGFLQSMRGYGTLTFGNLTFGNRTKNVNFSGGYLYWQSGKKTISPGDYTVSSETMTEATIPQSDPYWYSSPEFLRYGNNGRLINKDNVSADKIRNGYATQGPVFGVSGIFPLGEKASFVFESMLGLFVTRREYIEDALYSNSTFNPSTGNFTNYYNVNVSTRDYGMTMIYVSPGVRFQSKQDFAWQLSLASTSFTSEVNNKTQAFPVPTFSLFKKF
jgi:hypothetical protein